MTFIPQIIDNTTPGESLRSGADKINMNFEAIEEEFKGKSLSGTFAARPSFGVAGRTYYDSTNNVLWVDTGSAWVQPQIVYASEANIPTADQKAALSGTVGEPGTNNPYVTDEDIATVSIEIITDLLELNYSPSAYTAELTPEAASTSQMAAHLAGINSALRSIQARLTALEP